MDEREKRVREALLKPLDEIKAAKLLQEDQLPKQDPAAQVSLRSYVDNPTGKGSAYVANRSAIKQGLNLQFVKLLQNFRREFYAIPYIYQNGDVLFHVKVPSEFYKENKISYDVLFLLQYGDGSKRRAHRNIKMFSNCPSFIFTYCYVYYKKGLIADKFVGKLPYEAISQPPVVRNPIESMGYEKSTYIAARYLLDGMCLTDDYINRFSKIMTPAVETELVNRLADPNLIVQIYQHAKYQQRKTHKKPLSQEEKIRRDEQNKKYAREQAKNKPKKGFIVHKSPRSRITAKKAIKALQNEKPIKNRK